MNTKQKPENKAERVAVFANKASNAANTYQLANTIIMLLVLLIFAGGFAYVGVPWYICLGVVVIAFIFFALGIARYRRISAAAAKADSAEAVSKAEITEAVSKTGSAGAANGADSAEAVNKAEITETVNKAGSAETTAMVDAAVAADKDVMAEVTAETGGISLDPGEVLVGTIPAVMRYGATRSVEVLGTGKILTPENALLVTNKAVWAITVPMPGQHQIISGADVGKWQWMTAYDEIAAKLRDMVSSMPLQQLMEQCGAKRLMRLTEIKRARTLPMTYAISLLSHDKRKFGYSIRTKEDFLNAKKLLDIN